ncbi:MAG: hypothetical protein HZA15_15630 [Nitrospirae bacterium]|nr:hypothetical protein [Nitrospirota bacterium]
MKKVVFILLLISSFAYAGNVSHFAPDVPLIETEQGFKEKIDYLCGEAVGDLTKYNDASIEDFIRQCTTTGQAVKKSSIASPKFKTAYLPALRSCDKVFRVELRARNTPVYNAPAYKPAVAAEKQIQVSNVQCRITRYDSIGNTWFSIKADVTNKGRSGSVYVTLQGLDFEGYERKTVILRDTLETGQTKTMTNETVLDSPSYNKIREWRVKD